MTDSMSFTARTTRGDGRGKGLGVPTINLLLEDCPKELHEGIYACRVTYDDAIDLPASMHYGPRPVFGAEPSCEVHVIDTVIETLPDTMRVEVVKRLRDVQDFAGEEDLVRQIQKDNDDVARLLGC